MEKLIKIPKYARIRIDDKIYRQSLQKPKVSDLVIDLGNFTYGICDMIHPDGKHIVIKDGWVAEVGVPIERVRKLIPYTRLDGFCFFCWEKWQSIKKYARKMFEYHTGLA